jgi:transglutaminase-like putative cysteine protease
MQLRTIHRTFYEYSGPSVDSHNELRLKPVTDLNQKCDFFEVSVDPLSKVYSYSTPSGDVHHFSVLDPHLSLLIVAESTVTTFLRNPFEGVNLSEPDFDFYTQFSVRQEFAEFLSDSPYVTQLPETAALAIEAKQGDVQSVVQFLIHLREIIYDRFQYVPGATNVHSLLREIFDEKAGVCQDLAHVMIAACRNVGIPARYVSGYLYLGDHHELRGTQATHAWVEVPLPNGRWMGVDPTNNILADERYIKIHSGRDYSDVTPTKGIFKGYSTKRLEVSVDVERVDSAVVA